MKKTMQKLIAALLAVCCVPVTAVTANAVDLGYYWGSTSWDALDGLEPINSYGIFWEYPYVYPLEDEGYGQVVIARPLETTIEMRIREDADPSAAFQAALDLLEPYYPTVKEQANYERNHASVIDPDAEYSQHPKKRMILWEEVGRLRFEVAELDENAQQIESDLLLGLARQHLISEFYGFGETAYYATGYLQYEVLTNYHDNVEFTTVRSEDGEWEVQTDIPDPIDWDAVQAYLDENHKGLHVEEYGTGEYVVSSAPERKVVTYPLYRITGAENMTFAEKVELACELNVKAGLEFGALFPASSMPPLLGHNALERAGDVTLDCELDIMDVIAANKYILGVDTLCDTAKKNADVSGDGTPDAADTLAILKEVTGVTTEFAES